MSIINVPKPLLSRLLYSNPVCLLTTSTTHDDKKQIEDETTEEKNGECKNVMVISWLTAIDNHGSFVCSINNSRQSLKLILNFRRFVLNIPTNVKGMEDLLLEIGSCSGSTLNKFSKFNLSTCSPGWIPFKDSSSTIPLSSSLSSSSTSPSIEATALVNLKRKRIGKKTQKRAEEMEELVALDLKGIVAHLVCEVNSHQEHSKGGHTILFCSISRAFVLSSHWNGLQLAPCSSAGTSSTSSSLPPPSFVVQSDSLPSISTPDDTHAASLIYFLGSKRFGHLSTG